MDCPRKDLLLTKLRGQLNEDKIKLWLSPYTTESNDGCIPQELIAKYSCALKYSNEEVAQALEELRLHALAKLEERTRFQEQGLATLRVKLTCAIPTTPDRPRKAVPIECNLQIQGSDLKELIAVTFEIPKDMLKLICKGRVVQNGRTLHDQDIKHGSDVMVMCMTASEAQCIREDSDIVEVQRMRRAAELLSTRADDDEYFNVQIADQKGQPINLPKEEKKALTIAMTLHEKGRAALKTKKVNMALPLFLEADEEFSKCRSDILNAVDNYAILCLDIVWCYFLLKNLDQLPNAESRLNKSEECFKRSYGEKMERLAAIKGGTGTEQALFMRLYLLQGIVAFHQGHLIQAQNLFGRAQFVLTLLHVDPEQLNEVMLMGFTEKEARLGLRAKNGNIQQAVDHIIEKRKEHKEINKQVDKDWKGRVRAKKLGKTCKGKMVNADLYDNLVSMDFPAGAVAEALRQTDNNFDAALEFLSEHPEIFALPDPEQPNIEVTEEMVQQIVSLGFSAELARTVLERFKGDVHRTIDQMLQNGGMPSYLTEAVSSLTSSNASSVSSSATSLSQPSTSIGTDQEKKKKEKNEIKNMIEDINTDESDHLDLTLDDEREALVTYQGLVDSLSKKK